MTFRVLKRVLDILLAAAGSLFFLPLAVLFTIAVKAEDGGPIFYRQERWGRQGKKFVAYKFRTMIPNADKKWGLKPAEEWDVRITRVGRWLRATAMDELPQLFNILKGDMSFVGPRALAAGEVDPSAPDFQKRHQIRPGLTGPTQVFAPRDIPLNEKFKFDLQYVENYSWQQDIKLMFLSLAISLRGRWESRQKKV